ncbi:unnamed protein product [Coffea canephora]|uniref:Neprosin PEP catalytic domain-containing protein n=1 Tax=Coffea canephora TaxID=49390 RepID=A0A068UT01_COFCA|nr:unnamed protein product [Coffea canephora]
MSFWKELEEKRKLVSRNHATTKFNPKDLWLEGRGCPKGTVPIRQMTKEQQKRALRADQALKYPSLATGPILDFAGITVNADPGKKYGAAQAVINIYNPKVVGPGHYSSATIAIESGENQIQMGWIVHPQLYGDYRTRLYSSWTADNSRSTGCFNNNCPGFVVLSRDIPLDYAFPSISQPEEQQYDSLIGLALVSFQWLLVFEFNTVIGYWPNSILPNLASGADTLRWGG